MVHGARVGNLIVIPYYSKLPVFHFKPACFVHHNIQYTVVPVTVERR
jgi:hypothetical protein